ncbi:uncharacterized protein FMAN_14227 [Fusarium mangiferae]|uniref:EKC/KEOPS complex subunit BUD32 n=1 Tax=Fusarium mangiferae TaxID=192010 RepID=A0A1L7UCG4_FUSMA|nr:uncharacterized protein FMAN_14227 [Fusarium mangiferae]CVL08109.1 uncharacterized protein FMAN_14227 [Fusarium mangiferae]
MIAHLRLPFSLASDHVIASGAAGHVLAISQRIVLKCPTTFDNPAPSQEVDMKENIEKMKNEERIYSLLREKPHPHILISPLYIPQGIFLHRQAMTLNDRLEECSSKPLPEQIQERWIRQLSSALTWLENLGLIHGDLRPTNIFLAARGDEGDIQLGDFDCAVEKGSQLLASSEPFCKVLKNYELPEGSAITEQFSLGSCIYTIRFQRIPWHDLDPPTRVQKIMNGELPESSSDALFGGLMSRCWIGDFESVYSVDQEIIRLLQNKRGLQAVETMLSSMNPDLISTLEQECIEFLKKKNRAI